MIDFRGIALSFSNEYSIHDETCFYYADVYETSRDNEEITETGLRNFLWQKLVKNGSAPAATP